MSHTVRSWGPGAQQIRPKRHKAKRTKFKICERTGKRGYKTRDQAEASIVRNGEYLRPYRCEFCHRFHLTSEPPRSEPIQERKR